MVPMASGSCNGLAYKVPEEGRDEVLQALDIREQDGYERVWMQAALTDNDETVTALTWIASEGNPSWVGEEPLHQVARLIATRDGPSGSNREYLYRLHEAFEQLGIRDDHVGELVGEVKALVGRSVN